MEEALSRALLVLVVGMATVFTILSLVVISGQLLIRVVNSYSTEPVTKTNTKPNPESSRKDKAKIAAIIAAVDIATQGKGKIIRIDKE
jgi:oxaloacetate decarboxylase gamma subunit